MAKLDRLKLENLNLKAVIAVLKKFRELKLKEEKIKNVSIIMLFVEFIVTARKVIQRKYLNKAEKDGAL